MREGVVRDRMAADTGCAPEGITVERLPGNAYRASGCGRVATYACSYPTGGELTCIREAEPPPAGTGH
ncbi:MAG TPA: hypothetical protein VFN91_08925 [Myxococcaceae bacterium]|nr:hypothetical protein [Myxococcaceae bacterium]